MNKAAIHKTQRRGSPADFIIRMSPQVDEAWCGKIEHIHTGQVQLFRSYREMLLLIQGKLDQINFPQADTEMRTWPE